MWVRFPPGTLGISESGVRKPERYFMHSRIFLIRHGATALPAEDRLAGATDVELSDEGREQVRRLAIRLAGDNIVALHASPLGSTVRPARLLAEPHGWEVQPRPGRRELPQGHRDPT